MIERPRIAFVVDVPQRDLDGIALVGQRLCREGATCFLIPSTYWKKEVWALQPDAVLLFSARISSSAVAEQLAAAGIQIGLLEAEGGVWPSPEEYAKLLWDRQRLSLIEYVCAWGPALATYSEREAFFSRRQISITGCPRFDFYAPEWRPALLTEDAGPVLPRGRRMLVSTRSQEANPRFSTIEANRIGLQKRQGFSARQAQDYLDAELRAMPQLVECVRSLSRDFSDSRIVLRPHPFEGVRYYAEQFASLPQVEINTTGAIQPQIFQAALVIQRGSSIGVEAGLASVPSLSPQWIEVPYEIPGIEAVSVPSRNYGELAAQVSSILEGSFEVPADTTARLEEIVRDWFYRVDGKSHERVAATVLERLPRKRRVLASKCRRNLYGLSASSFRARTSGRIRYGLRLHPQLSFRDRKVRAANDEWLRSDLYFGVKEVRDRVRRIEQVIENGGRAVDRVEVANATEAGSVTARYRSQAVALWSQQAARLPGRAR